MRGDRQAQHRAGTHLHAHRWFRGARDAAHRRQNLRVLGLAAGARPHRGQLERALRAPDHGHPDAKSGTRNPQTTLIDPAAGAARRDRRTAPRPERSRAVAQARRRLVSRDAGRGTVASLLHRSQQRRTADRVPTGVGCRSAQASLASARAAPQLWKRGVRLRQGVALRHEQGATLANGLEAIRARKRQRRELPAFSLLESERIPSPQPRISHPLPRSLRAATRPPRPRCAHACRPRRTLRRSGPMRH